MKQYSDLTICMFSNLYPPVHSGSATQCAQLSRELAHRGSEVVVITAKVDSQSEEYEQVDGVHIYRLPALHLPKMAISLNFPWLNSTFLPSNQKRINEIFVRHNPDVIHLHNHMFDLAFRAVGAARHFQIPLIISIHTVIKHPFPLFNLLLYPADRWFLKHYIIQKADVLICPDKTIDEYVREAFGVANTVLLPYGISPMVTPRPEELIALREKHGLLNGPIILSLGHLHEIRNRRELIKVMPKLLEHFPHLKLLIVGDVGTSSAEILASRLGVRDAVIFTGAVPHTEISAYLAIADLEAHWFQLSNPQNKTLGIAALEAMAAGRVVFGTADKDVYGEGVLRDGKNVILVNLNDLADLEKRLIDLLQNESQRVAIGQQAQNTIINNFSWESVCEQTTEAYQRAIQKQT